MPAALRIGVIGEGTCSKRTAALARRVGAEVARAGAVLFSGGRGGVMEAASRGASEAGGLVVGILPGFRGEDANRWVAVPVVTGMDQARNIILVRSCHAVIAVGRHVRHALRDRHRPQDRPARDRSRHVATRSASRTSRAGHSRRHARGGGDLGIRAARSARGSRRWLS
jgi:hypothetical protein